MKIIVPAGRFTLVELMMVVTVLAVLAAVAVPLVYDMQMRAKRAEVYPNVEGIRKAEVAYELAHEAYFGNTWNPIAVPGRSTRPWEPGTDFETIGFAPDGDVYASYLLWLSGHCPTSIFIAANLDLDGDGISNNYGICADGDVQLIPSPTPDGRGVWTGDPATTW